MSQAIIQLENELHKDQHLRKMIEKLKEDLMKKGKKILYYDCLTPR